MAVTKVIGAWPLPDEVFLTLTDDNKITIKDNSITKDKIAFKTIFLEAYAEGSGTSVTFTNTTVSDGFYLIYFTKTNTDTVFLYVNGDTTGSNYQYHKWYSTGSSTGQGIVDDAIIMQCQSNIIFKLIKDSQNYPRAVADGFSGTTAVGYNSHYTWTYKNTVNDITEIQLTWPNSADFKVYLYKVMI